MPSDISFMSVALTLARRNLGQTWPNPAVGAVLVKDGQIIAQGSTARGGRPHAETQALANIDAKGATLYVTLEPCSHHGKTPPCVDAIIQAGVARVVVACRDPNPQVNGQGIEALKNAGIEVVENVCADEAREINRGFFSVIEKGRPFVALKIATSQDGKITNPKQRWITGEPARNSGQMLRSQYDAIATGIGTVLADDPLLTCRLPGLEDRSPVRVLFDRHHRLPPESKLAQGELWQLDDRDVTHGVKKLADKGITRLLLETGRALSLVFLNVGLVDKIYWFRAPMTIGEDGLDLGISLPPPGFTRQETRQLGEDVLEVYTKNQACFGLPDA